MRILALVLIVVAIAGVAYLKFQPDDGTIATVGITTEDVLDENSSDLEISDELSDSEITAPQQPIEPILVVAENLEIPWDIAFLPDGDLLVTERPGRVVRIDAEGNSFSVAVPNVRHRGEGGLLGITLHPKFASNHWVYLYSTQNLNEEIENVVTRYVYRDDELIQPRVIIDGIPGAIYHDGGRMEWGPDGKLYITTGDATTPALAQNMNSLGGKILRMNDDGSLPEDNPFPDSFVYSLGHRNPQGLAWDSAGKLWSTEHGPSLPTHCCRDEVNLIVPGKNYGWPEISGSQTAEGLEAPILQSGSSITWAPAGLAQIHDSLFFGGLRGETLYQVKDLFGTPSLVEHFVGEYGRIRTTRIGPDGLLYITTSNHDGRGSPAVADDRIIRIDPSIF